MDLLKKIVIIVFFIVSVIFLCKTLLLGNYPDFNSFYFATKLYVAGSNPYTSLCVVLAGFLYAPTSFLFFAPFILFSLQIAGFLWTFLSIGLLVCSIVLLFRMERRSIYSLEFLGILGGVFLMFPVKFTLGMGQVGIINLFLVVHFLYYSNQKKEKLAALFLSLSLLLKFTPIFFPLYLLIHKKWKILFGTGLISLLILAIVTLYRPDQMFYFLTTSLPATFKSWPLAYYNQAISGMIGRELGKTDVAQMIKYGISLILVGITSIVLWKNRKKDKELLSYGSLLPLSIIIAPLAWQHYFVLIIPTLVLLYFSYSRRETSRWQWLLLGISYLLLATNLKDPEIVPSIIRSHVLGGAMLLWGLSLYEISKHK